MKSFFKKKEQLDVNAEKIDSAQNALGADIRIEPAQSYYASAHGSDKSPSVF